MPSIIEFAKAAVDAAPAQAHIDLGINNKGLYAVAEAEVMDRTVYRKEFRSARHQHQYQPPKGRGRCSGWP